MKYVDIDRHERFLVAAVEDERDRPRKPRRFACRDTQGIRGFFETPSRVEIVSEASASDRWL